MSGSDARSALDRVVLPAPEGEDMTRRRPRRAMWARDRDLFTVRHLLVKRCYCQCVSGLSCKTGPLGPNHITGLAAIRETHKPRNYGRPRALVAPRTSATGSEACGAGSRDRTGIFAEGPRRSATELSPPSWFVM